MEKVSFFNQLSFELTNLFIKKYSTSFYLSSLFFEKNTRQAIFNIYGFVRLADEIVDSFLEFNRIEILKDFEEEVYKSLKRGISPNPVLNSFILTVKEYRIDIDLIRSFLESMKQDLYKKEYISNQELQKYIYGSAEVIGLMCLRVFTKQQNELYEELKKYAIKLGSAFQKINFLRDLNYDVYILKRKYFPKIDFSNFQEEDKNKIIYEIEKEFKEARIGIRKLPSNSKLAVWIAYNFYNQLLNKIKKTSALEIFNKRIRISNLNKFLLIFKCYLEYKLNLI